MSDWREGDTVRPEPDDGRRWTLDPASDDDATPWRIDDDNPPRWVGEWDLPVKVVRTSAVTS